MSLCRSLRSSSSRPRELSACRLPLPDLRYCPRRPETSRRVTVPRVRRRRTSAARAVSGATPTGRLRGRARGGFPAPHPEGTAMNSQQTTGRPVAPGVSSPLSSPQIVRTFLDFFHERGHHQIPGSPLVPRPGDPVLFTTSGMHPLTPYLEGQPHPGGRRLTNVQRCLRTTDLDEVGDRTHLTVFEMLGSWSLRDYPGSQSLRWGHELITGGFGIGPGLLHATVFGGSDQAGPDTGLAEVWGELGVPVELTGEDNWWSNGPTGLCGTDSELTGEANWWSKGPTGPCGTDSTTLPRPVTTPPKRTPSTAARWAELWNHVM